MAADAQQNSQSGDIVGYTKPRKFLFWKIKSKPIYSEKKAPAATAAQPAATPKPVASAKPSPFGSLFGKKQPYVPPTPKAMQTTTQATPTPTKPAAPATTPQPTYIPPSKPAVAPAPQPAPKTAVTQPSPVVKPAPPPPFIPSQPQYAKPQTPVQPQRVQNPTPQGLSIFSRPQPAAKSAAAPRPAVPRPQQTRGAQMSGKMSRYEVYINNVLAKQKGLDILLRTQQISSTPQDFVKKMMNNAIIVSAVVGIALVVLIYTLLSTQINNPLPPAILVGAVSAIGCYQFMFRQFLNYPRARARDEGKQAEAGILFAARDIIISLRSGIPLFNAMTSVSSGYGAASKEFARIVSLIQLGTPMDQAIDQVSATSQSKTFKRIMLQASVSIREGADVVQALEEVVEQVMQERVIELRRYGQRLNAISMFYMLFGVIFPSMGVAVLTILTTFISIFTVNTDFLILILIFVGLLQFIFLNIMRSSRPVFSM